jgi:hypothetical protein
VDWAARILRRLMEAAAEDEMTGRGKARLCAPSSWSGIGDGDFGAFPLFILRVSLQGCLLVGGRKAAEPAAALEAPGGL